MRIRHLRPQIYQPIVRFGVPLSDWKFIVIIAAFSYAIPFLLDLHIYGIPLPLVICLAALMMSITFFNWARRGRRPLWLQHTLQAVRSHKLRRVVPADRNGRGEEPWILDRDI